ncbi:hypothetical protein HDU79_002230 [Rhizoclosmatium sp. JEL0117]|nr:hypothetical protein HDU79_002230 [Rhizoclosmatium sp. JEL0117]
MVGGVDPSVQKQLAKIFVPPRAKIPLAELEATIDIMQARFLDFLNGEEGAVGSAHNLFGGSLQSIPGPFNARTTFNRVHQFALEISKVTTYEYGSLIQTARRTRALLIAYRLVHEQPSLLTLLALSLSDARVDATEARRGLEAELNTVINELTAVLYDWIDPRTIRSMHLDFLQAPEMGIVISCGVWHFEMATVGILALREILGSTLPIEVHYLGDEDLTPNMVAVFKAMPGVTLVDLYEKFPLVDLEGWAIKPYSMLAANFRNVIFVDADALFFQDPERIVRQSLIYKQFGQLFYHDRTVFKDDHVDWFFGINPEMTKYASGLRYTNGLSTHEMESGVVVVDKGRTGVLHALLATCQMNGKEEREVAYRNMHGDKETFWMSWDLTRVPYRFVPNYGGAIGYRNKTTGNICGGLYHPDEYNQPAWWNGGVLNNKYDSLEDNYMSYEYVATDSYGYDIEWQWDFEYNSTPFCLKPRDPANEIRELEPHQKTIGYDYIKLYKEVKTGKGGWKQYFSDKYKLKLNMKEVTPKKKKEGLIEKEKDKEVKEETDPQKQKAGSKWNGLLRKN